MGVGGWLVIGGWWLVVGVWLVGGVWCLMFGVWLLVVGAECMIIIIIVIGGPCRSNGSVVVLQNGMSSAAYESAGIYGDGSLRLHVYWRKFKLLLIKEHVKLFLRS